MRWDGLGTESEKEDADGELASVTSDGELHEAARSQKVSL